MQSPAFESPKASRRTSLEQNGYTRETILEHTKTKPHHAARMLNDLREYGLGLYLDLYRANNWITLLGLASEGLAGVISLSYPTVCTSSGFAPYSLSGVVDLG